MDFFKKYRQSLFLSVLTAGSYILGYARDKIFAHYYGLSETLDIYHASFIIPDTVMNLFLAGAMVSILVPWMNKFDQKRDQGKELSAIISFSLILNIIVCAVLYLVMPSLVPLVVHNPDYIEPVIFYSRILLLSPLIFLLSNFFGGILVKKRNLVFYGLSPILYNLGIIAGVVIFHAFGILGIILGALLGAVCHLLIRFIGVMLAKERVELGRVRLAVDWLHIKAGLAYFFQLAWPKMLSLTILHLNYWLFTYYASRSGTEGAIFALNISRNFYNVPISVIAIALATDAFSLLAKEYTQKEKNNFKKIFQRYLLLIGLSGLVFGIIYYFFSPLFVSVLLKGGKFDAQDVEFTARLLGGFGLVIVFESLMQYFARVLHAVQDTFWQMVSQLTCFITTYIFLFFVFNSFDIVAIPLSFTAGMFVQNIVQAVVISFKMKTIKANV